MLLDLEEPSSCQGLCETIENKLMHSSPAPTMASGSAMHAHSLWWYTFQCVLALNMRAEAYKVSGARRMKAALGTRRLALQRLANMGARVDGKMRFVLLAA